MNANGSIENTPRFARITAFLKFPLQAVLMMISILDKVSIVDVSVSARFACARMLGRMLIIGQYCRHNCAIEEAERKKYIKNRIPHGTAHVDGFISFFR